MTATNRVDCPAPENELEPAPLVEVAIELVPALTVRMDRCVGEVPMLEIMTARNRVLISVDAGDVRQLGTEHVSVAEAFADAACALRDEVRGLVSR
jgi:hypothetical protein